LRTAESAAPIAAQAVAASLIAFIVVYFAVFGAGVFYLLRLMAKPPMPDETDHPSDAHLRSSGIVPAPALDSVGELPTETPR
jgi:cytochrome d ubiquinol oxidase subunit I